VLSAPVQNKQLIFCLFSVNKNKLHEVRPGYARLAWIARWATPRFLLNKNKI
jgi:hypothetical protein